MPVIDDRDQVLLERRLAKLLMGYDGHTWQLHPGSKQSHRQDRYLTRAQEIINLVRACP